MISMKKKNRFEVQKKWKIEKVKFQKVSTPVRVKRSRLKNLLTPQKVKNQMKSSQNYFFESEKTKIDKSLFTNYKL